MLQSPQRAPRLPARGSCTAAWSSRWGPARTCRSSSALIGRARGDGGGRARAHAPQPSPLAGASGRIGMLMLFLGTGFDNLVWAFQMGFVGGRGSGCLGDGHRPAGARLQRRPPRGGPLDATATGCSTSRRRRCLLGRRSAVLLIPIASYSAWYVLIGNRGVPVEGPIAEYAVRLVGSIFGGVAGVGWATGLIVAGAVHSARLRPVAHLASCLPASSASSRRSRFWRSVEPTSGRSKQRLPGTSTWPPHSSSCCYLGVRLPRPAWTVLFATAFALNVAALPRGVAIYHAFLDYDRSIPLEERLAPYR